MKRHTNKWLGVYDDEYLEELIDVEQLRGHKKFGPFASMHELYAVLLEEVQEFWESVKANDPDPEELLQVCAVAKRGIVELCQRARKEANEQLGEERWKP